MYLFVFTFILAASSTFGSDSISQDIVPQDNIPQDKYISQEELKVSVTYLNRIGNWFMEEELKLGDLCLKRGVNEETVRKHIHNSYIRILTALREQDCYSTVTYFDIANNAEVNHDLFMERINDIDTCWENKLNKPLILDCLMDILNGDYKWGEDHISDSDYGSCKDDNSEDDNNEDQTCEGKKDNGRKEIEEAIIRVLIRTIPGEEYKKKTVIGLYDELRAKTNAFETMFLFDTDAERKKHHSDYSIVVYAIHIFSNISKNEYIKKIDKSLLININNANREVYDLEKKSYDVNDLQTLAEAALDISDKVWLTVSQNGEPPYKNALSAYFQSVKDKRCFTWLKDYLKKFKSKEDSSCSCLSNVSRWFGKRLCDEGGLFSYLKSVPELKEKTNKGSDKEP